MKCGCRKADGFLRGLFLGILAGAGVYYFLNSTQEGEKIKKRIKEHGGETLENLDELIKELEKKGQEFSQRAKDFEKKLERKAKTGFPEISNEVKKELTSIDKLRQRGRKTTKLFTHKGKPLKKKSS